ncbi:MAG: succinylglutamate desuccinylase/aspartoacylase family protein [Candidatus Algichlamydia australiensis]|nr:succinylglutamate desuccinylase/aspartoacylase family protein [Chlamydiales bacterium]
MGNVQKNSPLKICDTVVQPGERVTLGLPTPEFYSCSPSFIPIHVIHGKKSGPTLLVCAASHGDEMNGVAIIQKLLEMQLVNKIRGTLIAVPVINVFGLISRSRNLPGEYDFEDSFPGSESGSFSSRLAHRFSEKILSLATHCIDLQTGSLGNYRVPQVYTDTDHDEAFTMARSFAAPIIMHTKSDRGMLWKLQRENSIPTLVYESGESSRMDEPSITVGAKGVVRVMRDLGMIGLRKNEVKEKKSVVIRSTQLLRSPCSGIFFLKKKLGSSIRKNDVIASIVDPFGAGKKREVTSNQDGVMIAASFHPLVSEGEPIVHLGKTEYEESHNIFPDSQNIGPIV